MNIKKITNNIILIDFKTQKDLTQTFLRFQEYYESPKFKNKIFTIGQFKNWYAQEYGAFTYDSDWAGMNIPSYVLEPFYKGLFDPLTKKEKKFLNLFKERTDNFYIIGTYNKGKDTLDHEVCHGLFYTIPKYKNEVLKELKKYNLNDLKKWLLKIGYCKEVIDDECHAYISSDWKWLKKNNNIKISEELHKKLRKIKKKYI